MILSLLRPSKVFKLKALLTVSYLTIGYFPLYFSYCHFSDYVPFFGLFWLLISYIINSVLHFLKIGTVDMLFCFPVKYFDGPQSSLLLFIHGQITFMWTLIFPVYIS